MNVVGVSRMNWRHRVQEIITGKKSHAVYDFQNNELKKIIDKCRLKHPYRDMKHIAINPITTTKKYELNGNTYRVKTQLLLMGCGRSKGIGLYGRNAFKLYEKLHIFPSSDAVPKHLENAICYRSTKDKSRFSKKSFRSKTIKKYKDPNAKWVVWELIKTAMYKEEWRRGKLERTSIINTDIQNANGGK